MSGGCESSKKCAAFWIGVGAALSGLWAVVIGVAYANADNKGASTASFATAGGLFSVAAVSFCVSRFSSCCKRSSEPGFSGSASPS